MQKAVLSKLITKAVQGTFEPHVCKRYIKEFNFGVDAKPDDAYALAIKFLNQSETEICISYIIAALDISKEHNPSFHLAKTMVFSLAEEFEKSGGQLYKQKNPDLNKYVLLLEKNVQKFESEVLGFKNNLKQLESETGMFAKMKNKSKIAELQAQIPEVNDKIDKNKKELKKVMYLAQIEEYSKVLSLIMEVLTFPSRYSWVYKA
jgi:predicted RNase H-like nuclease (RuvC/YqgF family)